MGLCGSKERNERNLEEVPIARIKSVEEIGYAGKNPVEEAKSGGLMWAVKKKDRTGDLTDRTGELTDLPPPKIWLSNDHFEKWENSLPF